LKIKVDEGQVFIAIQLDYLVTPQHRCVSCCNMGANNLQYFYGIREHKNTSTVCICYK